MKRIWKNIHIYRSGPESKFQPEDYSSVKTLYGKDLTGKGPAWLREKKMQREEAGRKQIMQAVYEGMKFEFILRLKKSKKKTLKQTTKFKPQKKKGD